MTEEEIQTILDRGHAAAKLLDDPTLGEVLEGLEKDTLERWRRTMSRDIDGRETLYATLQGLDMFKAELLSRLNSAKITADKVEKQRQREAEKAKGRLRIVGGWREP